MNQNEPVLDKDKDADASSPQADDPSVLLMKTHNEPVLDKNKLKYDMSASSKCFLIAFVSELFFFCL
jgi:hypothetical protein